MVWVRGLFLVFTALVFSAQSLRAGPFSFDCGKRFERLALRARQRELKREYLEHQFGEGKRPVSTSEKFLTFDMQERILPFIKQRGVAGEFTGAKGLAIKYWKFEHPNEKGAVVISHGFSEALSYYPELIYNLYERGYSVYFLDHRGHGESGRLMKNATPVHVNQFQDYVDDLKTFIDTQVKTKPHAKIVVVGHSMGGLISTLYTKQNPGSTDGLVLSAPLFAPNLFGLPQAIAGGLARLFRGVGFGEYYAFGQSAAPVFRAGFDNNPLTTSRARFLEKWLIFNKTGEDRNNGATFSWVAEAIGACKQGRCAGPEIAIPTLVMTAGDDKVVLNKATGTFCKGLKNCQTATFPKARHDLLGERDEIRDEVMTKLFEFLDTTGR